MSTADLFDINPSGSDSHMQFMNWAVDNNGAYDYAADTRGYTWGFIAEYQGPYIELRLGEMMMPKVANGLDLDPDILNARADNLELEVKYLRRPGFRGTVRLLGYINHARMGSYAEAVAAPGIPDITAHRAVGRTKMGVGLNLIQELWGRAHVFARAGWNDGKNESFAYTEIDDTVQIGFDVLGTLWRRRFDKLGAAFVTNGLSPDHREYLRRGGLGFVLGDGNLSYARETIFEAYYNAQVWRGAFLAGDVQFITNPGYNAARGPVWVFSLRGHLEF
jgi:carbohydrate-selective porin OprB